MTRHPSGRTTTGAPRLIRRALATSACVAATLGLAAPAGAATSVQIDDGALQIHGDAASNKIALVNQAAAFAIDLGADGTAEFTADRTAFTRVEVKAGGGDDEVSVVNGGGAVEMPITLDGGAGNDTLRGGAGAETFIGGAGDDVADGNIGADTARLGSGNDRFQWDPGDASDTVEGQAGADALDFNASNAPEQVDVSRNGGRVRLTRNVGSVTMDFNDVESAVLRALGGSDQITVGDLTGTDLKTADVDLGAIGGGGDGQQDTVVVNGRERADNVDVTASGTQVLVGGLPALTRISGSESLNDTLRLNTLGGSDQVTIDPDAELLITPVVDLGAGQ
jgi:Ca2+-binding RTX toxin-like protein